MAKYNKEMTQRCADWVSENGLMEYGGAKLMDFCKAFGIDNKTYYAWLDKPEFSDAIKRAKEKFKESLETDIVKSLANAAKGYEYTQTQTEYKDVNGLPKIVKQTKKNIRVESNVGAAIFLLTNIAPDRWKNKQSQDVNVGNIEADNSIQVEIIDNREQIDPKE